MTNLPAALTFEPVDFTLEDVSTYRKDRIATKLATINKRLTKIGAPKATVAFGPVVTKKWRDELTGFERSEDYYETVTVTGFEARFAGWTGVASLDWTYVGDQALVAKFPGQEVTVFPEAFTTGGPVCDHCGLDRNRHVTIVFAHDDGRFTRVGTSCILEYIGIDPATVLWLAGGQFAFGDDEDEDEGGGHSARQYASPAEFLAAAAEATRINGFTPSRPLDPQDWPTREQAERLVYGRIKAHEMARMFPGFDADRGRVTADAVTAWVDALPSNGWDDFNASAKLALRANRAGEKTYGILAALPYSYMKATEKLAAKAAAADATIPSEWIGTVGEKLSVDGTVILDRSFDTQFGTSKLIVVKLETGEEVATFGSGGSLWDAAVGMKVRFSGKIKAHEDKGYGKRTMLKGAKLFELDTDGTPLPSAGSNTSHNHAYGEHDETTVPKACYHCAVAAKAVTA